MVTKEIAEALVQALLALVALVEQIISLAHAVGGT